VRGARLLLPLGWLLPVACLATTTTRIAAEVCAGPDVGEDEYAVYAAVLDRIADGRPVILRPSTFITDVGDSDWSALRIAERPEVPYPADALLRDYYARNGTGACFRRPPPRPVTRARKPGLVVTLSRVGFDARAGLALAVFSAVEPDTEAGPIWGIVRLSRTSTAWRVDEATIMPRFTRVEAERKVGQK
jgi:hypothetical protein